MKWRSNRHSMLISVFCPVISLVSLRHLGGFIVPSQWFHRAFSMVSSDHLNGLTGKRQRNDGLRNPFSVLNPNTEIATDYISASCSKHDKNRENPAEGGLGRENRRIKGGK
jgi:hypothetical protein